METYGNFQFLCLIVLMTILITSTKPESVPQRLRPPPTYAVVAPKLIRPDQDVQVHISVFHLPYSSLSIRASIRRDRQELASSTETFTEASSRLTQLQVPENAENGTYSLLVEGMTGERSTEPIFSNETDLIFQPKKVSAFIFTDQHFYSEKQTIRFRVVALKPNLTPVSSDSIEIFLKDAGGVRVRRLQNQQVNGFYENSFELGGPIKRGTWTLEVHGWGSVYRKSFVAARHYQTRFEQRVISPPVISENDYAVGGTVQTYDTNNHAPIRGNATVEIEVVDPEEDKKLPRVKKFYSMVHGNFGFNFPLSEIRNATGGVLADCDVYIHATVRDTYTQREETFNGYTRVTSGNHFLRFLGGRVRVFKPGQPLVVKVAVFSKSGQKLASSRNRLVKLRTLVRKRLGSTEQKEQSVVIGRDSIAHYTYDTKPDDEFIKVSVEYADGFSNIHTEMTAYRHYTKSGHYLFVTTSAVHPEIDAYIVFTVHVTTPVPEINYLIMAKGNILVANKLIMKSRQKTFAVAVSRDMLPEARIVMWGVLNSGEILADTLHFHVTGLTQRNMTVRVNTGKDVRQNTMEINSFTDTAAFSAFSGELEQMIELGIKPFFTEYDVEEELMTYDTTANYSMKHTWHDGRFGRKNIFYTSPSYAVDANSTFVFAGLVIVTDAALTRIEAASSCNVTLGYLPCYDGGCYRISEGCDGLTQCEDGADEMGCPERNPPEYILTETFSKTAYRWAWIFEQRTWLWKGFFTKPYGRIDFPVTVPSRPDKWVISGFSLDRGKGLAFNKVPVTVDTTKPVYMTVELPKTAVRGEQLGVQVTVFNTMEQTVDVILQIHDSDDFRFIKIEELGYVSSYNPRTVRGDIQTMVTSSVCVCPCVHQLSPGKSRMIHFPILPVVLGSLRVTISLHSFIMSHEVTKEITIKMDGVTNYYHTPVLIDLVSTGSLNIPFLQVPVPERFIDPGRRRHLYVPGSGEVTVSFIGDVVGAGLYTSHLDTYKMFGRVGGQCEQYIHDLATNLYWLKFLKTTNQLSSSLLLSSLRGVNQDLQRVYAYMSSDGGMSLRRKRVPNDVWTTALALEVLSAAVDPEWEHIVFVDINVIQRLGTWLVEHQNTSTGAFINNDLPYNINMRDTMTDEDGRPANISITAQASVALYKSLNLLSGMTKTRAAAAVGLAGDYLSSWLHRLTEPFEICIVTYALHEINHQSRTEAFNIMKSANRSENFVYWSKLPVAANTLEFVNALPYLHSRDVPSSHQSRAVQATSYALLVYMRKNLFADATPIMKWLQTQRDHFGGFSSTADSLVALQALMRYAERETNRDFYKMYFNLEASSTSGWQDSFHFDSSNYLSLSETKLPLAWGSVKTSAAGTGIALCQMTSKVNVEYPDQVRQPPERAFDLDIENLVFSGRNGSLFEMTVCLRWVATHRGDRSGSAVLEVDIPTGYYVRKNDIRAQQRASRLIMHRPRFTKQKVVYHFNYLDTVRTCFYFPSERWYPVANATIQHEIKVYDTYEPALINRTLYTTYSLFHLHICQVCGSFQCPYCPFYNTAAHREQYVTSVLFIYLVLARFL